MATLKFRPHHFLCTLGFEGKGYSPSFVENYLKISALLNPSNPSGDSIPIRVVQGSDSICHPCPHRTDETSNQSCEFEAKISTLDAAHSAALGIQPDQELTWGEAKALIQKKITPPVFEAICAPCGWKSLGICQKALQKLQSVSLLCLGAILVLAAATPAQCESVLLDTAQETLLSKKKSAIALTLKNAYAALQDEDYEKAKKLAVSAQKDHQFFDYGFWIEAMALKGQATEAIDEGKAPDAVKFAQKARIQLSQIGLRMPDSPLAKPQNKDLATMDLIAGSALYLQSKWGTAIEQYERAFTRLLLNGGLGPARSDHVKNYAQACSKTPSEGCQAWLLKMSLTFPRTSDEVQTIGQLFESLGNQAKAPPSNPKLPVPYKAPDLDQVSFESALRIYRESNYTGAIKAFRGFLDEFPKSGHRFRARYWLAQALSHEQAHDQAKKVYESIYREAPFGYYGLLAASASGQNLDATIDGSVPRVLETDPYLLPTEINRLRRAQVFLTARAHELAAMELKELRPRDGLSSPFLLYLAQLNSEAKNHATAFVVITELIQRGYEPIYSSYGLRMIFPTEYLDLIEKHAANYQLDPVLVLSLIKQESAFESGVFSWVGASGLMQLMPATAIETVPGTTRESLLDPDLNIQVGTKYLRQLLNRFNGNIVLALAAYNAGPTATDRWVKEFNSKKGSGMLDFIESITYKETRDYVASIVRNYYWYSRRLTGEAPKPLTYFWNIYGPPELPAKVK